MVTSIDSSGPALERARAEGHERLARIEAEALMREAGLEALT